jgi:hypothetical protein
MKVIANVLLFFDVLLFLPWPLLSLFVLGFAFDDPKTGFSAANIIAVIIFLTYPYGFFRAWSARRKAKMDGADWCTTGNVGLLALPYAHFAALFALFHLYGKN